MKKTVVIFFCCLIASTIYGSGLLPNEQNKLKVGFVQQAIPISNVTSLGGFAGERILKNRENYLKTFPIDEYLDFIIQRTHKDWTWVKAEQHGKWIESSILNSTQSKDDTLRKKAAEIFTRLIASQEPEGYLGATSPEVRTPEKPLRGMDAYELYFVQHALLTAYEQCMLPFSNIGIWYLDGKTKPEPNSKSNSYAIFCEGIRK